jgi:hypothetical protein
VRRYEPYFDTGFDHLEPCGDRLGLSVAMTYDPRGELTRTLNPDGSEQPVVRGVPADLTDPEGYTPTPWDTYTYDANDNAGRTHGRAAAGYQSHWNTPASVELDALGRTVRAVARNGATPDTWLVTLSAYDIVGDLVTITDALGRVAFRYTYDLTRYAARSVQAEPTTVPCSAPTPPPEQPRRHRVRLAPRTRQPLSRGFTFGSAGCLPPPSLPAVSCRPARR